MIYQWCVNIYINAVDVSLVQNVLTQQQMRLRDKYEIHNDENPWIFNITLE